MSLHILKCRKCKEYTIRKICPSCGGEAVSPLPTKYSPEDTYGKYRREVKKEELKKEGLL
jgi:H/ACA ribonucleoprotein complex subunit 3